MRFILVLFYLFCTKFGFSNSEVGQSDVAYKNWESTVTRADRSFGGKSFGKIIRNFKDEIRNWRSV